MTFLLIVYDGSQMRAFHPSVMEDGDRWFIEQVASRLVRRADDLFNGKVGGSTKDLIPSHAEVAVAINKAMYGESKSLSSLLTQSEIARTSGYTGDVCPHCQGFRVKRTGSCVTCEDCGSNAGCG